MTAAAGWVPPGKQTFFDPATSEVLAGGFVYHYVPGSDVLKDTWQDYNQDALNENPIPLDENGQAVIWGVGNYRQRLTDANDVEIWDRAVTVGNQGDITLAQGAIMGLQIANNGGNPTTQIDVAIGQARDSTNEADIQLESAMTKLITAVWAAGTGAGMRDSATALAAGQSYHMFVIYNPTTLAVDVLCSQSATAPNLPNGYTLFRRIGSLPLLGTDNRPAAGTNIPTFSQWGDRFDLASPNNEFTGQTGSTAASLKTFLVPLGIRVEALIYAQNNNPGTVTLLAISNPGNGVPVGFGGTNQWANIRTTSDAPYLTALCRCVTNTSGQVYVQVSDAAAAWAAKSIGWVDRRGQDGQA